VHELAHGNLAAALSLNALVVFVLPVLIYSGVKGVARRVFGVTFRERYVPSRWLWILVAAVAAFGVLRNVSVWPLSWLAP
jgi:hypothetical protein